jgi:hypothetical protein
LSKEGARIVKSILLVIAIVSLHARVAGSSDFLTERSSGYRYLLSSGHLSDVPTDVWNAGFDDSSWTLATSPFGTGADACFGLASATSWDLPALTIVTRISFEVPLGTTRLVLGVVANGGIRTTLNGTLWEAGSCSGPCPCGFEQNPVPLDLWHVGRNVLVIGCECGSAYRHLAAYAYGDVTPTFAATTTWGRLKALYRP